MTIRLRKIMAEFLRSRGISPDRMTNGPMKMATLKELGFDPDLPPPPNRVLREILANPSKAKPFYILRSSFYDSDEWRDVRYRTIKKYGACCQCCGARASREKPIHVDHIKPRSKYPELALDLENLQVLCVDCNVGKRAWDETDWRIEIVAA